MAEEQSTRGKCPASRGQCWASAFCSRFPRRQDTPSSAPVPTDAQALASSLPVTSLSLGQEMPSSMALDLWSSKSEKPPICYRLSDPEPLYYWHHLAGLEPPLKAQGLLDRELLSVIMFQWKMGSKWQFLRCPPGRFHRCAMLNSVPQGFRFEESIKHKREMMAKCWQWH